MDILFLIFGVAQGLSHLHSREYPVVHGDIRGGNILISDAGVSCIIDFGLSSVLSAELELIPSTKGAGSIRWMAPELLDGCESTRETDVWAFAMTLLELLTEKPPYSDLVNDVAVLRYIDKGYIPCRPPTNEAQHLNDFLWSLCRLCWSVNATERPSMGEISEFLMEHTSKTQMSPVTGSNSQWIENKNCKCRVCPKLQKGTGSHKSRQQMHLPTKSWN